ncbi:MAG: hypothetical protein OES09_08060 [Gammaproteobacteria bacterium]|nr:hypothetical protein [Gammaproteobacteria bacterium]
MSNLLTGLIAMAMIVMFLGKYAITLNALPLWIIIVGVLVLIAYDYISSLRATRNEPGNNDQD